MLKDKVIKPLLVATEKVVEYYFPEEKKSGQAPSNHDSKVNDVNIDNKPDVTTTIINDDKTSVSS